MPLIVKIRSARSIKIDDEDVIQEISYQYSDPTLGKEVIDTAMALDISSIDVTAPGFIKGPVLTNLKQFVIETNEALPGAEGKANAHLTIIKQLADKNAAAAALIVTPVATVDDYVVEGVGIPEEEE